MKDFLGRAPVAFAPEKLSGRRPLALIHCGAWQIPLKILQADQKALLRVPNAPCGLNPSSPSNRFKAASIASRSFF